MPFLCWIRPEWPSASRVQAAFTLRPGGYSRGPYAGLNLGTHVGDVPRAVAANRARLHRGLKLPAEPVWLHQVHGTQVLHLPAAGGRPVADAAWTDRPGVVCAVQVADCLPVLLADREGTRVGAAHAGWRGLAAGVLEATVAAMGLPAGRLMAWLGPAIGPRSFEVGEEVHAAFAERYPGDAVHFQAVAPGRWRADLYGLARARLERSGVQSICGGGDDTFSDRGRYYSHRRDGVTGRMAALIWLQP